MIKGFRLPAVIFALLAVMAVHAETEIVISDVTVIDGTGAGPTRATVLIRDGRIHEIARSLGEGPGGDAIRIDGSGKYLLPGFIDTNVHASIYGNSTRRETVVKYGERNADLVLEFVQRQLRSGTTTVRDSYGALLPLLEVRDRIARGELVGPRMLVAGNIVGWGGPFSMTFSLMRESELTAFQAQWNDSIAQGVGEELLDMGPEEVRAAINTYLDKGPDFLKFGGTSHFLRPSLIGFAPRIQKVIVEETHKRGLIAETHSTSPEGLRISVEAGIDLIQHPEILSDEYPEDLIQMIVDRDVICAMRSNTLTGDVWRRHLRSKAATEERYRDAPPPVTSAERRMRDDAMGRLYEIERRNAERLIAAGCRVTIATDNYQGRAPEFRKQAKPLYQEAGEGSIMAIEGLVELGMSEMEAIVAATRNGAVAAGLLDEIGTIERGKRADVILLDADPLESISNIRRLSMVMVGGRIVDLDALPEAPVFTASGTKSLPRPVVAAVQPQTSVAEPRPAARKESVDAAESAKSAVRDIRKTPLGKLVVTLDNGEVWRQLNSDNTRVVLPKDRSKLTASLSKAMFGGTLLKINGTRRSFRVTRVD